MANKVEHTIIELYVDNECVKNWVVNYLFDTEHGVKVGDTVDDTYLCLPNPDATLYKIISLGVIDGVRVIKIEDINKD